MVISPGSNKTMRNWVISSFIYFWTCTHIWVDLGDGVWGEETMYFLVGRSVGFASLGHYIITSFIDITFLFSREHILSCFSGPPERIGSWFGISGGITKFLWFGAVSSSFRTHSSLPGKAWIWEQKSPRFLWFGKMLCSMKKKNTYARVNTMLMFMMWWC